MATLHVACAADRRYVGHSAAMIHSVLTESGMDDVHLHYLHGASFPRRSAAKLDEMTRRLGGSIDFHEIADERIAGLPAMKQVSITPTMWYRVFLAELLPDTERLLYLDVDTIVVGSLESLWDTDLADNYLGAVTNVFQADHEHNPAQVGLDAREYFNSGVLLLDLELMRRDGCMEAVREFALENRDRLIWPDQDALNVVLGRRRSALHPRWNSMNSLDFYRERSEKVFGPQSVREARERPGIRHFEGPWINKPWHILCERANRELYAGHRRATPWPRYRRTGLTPANLLRWPGVERRRRAQARTST